MGGEGTLLPPQDAARGERDEGRSAREHRRRDLGRSAVDADPGAPHDPPELRAGDVAQAAGELRPSLEEVRLRDQLSAGYVFSIAARDELWSGGVLIKSRASPVHDCRPRTEI